MRLMPILLVLLAGAADARECRRPDIVIIGNEVRGLEAFADCLLDRVADLQRRQTRLLEEIDDLRRALVDLPGELVNENGREKRFGGSRLAHAGFSLSARSRDSATALYIDHRDLGGLCGQGCTFTLLLSVEPLREASPAPVFATGLCAFHYNARSGVWGRSGDCGEPVSGIDGDGTPTGPSGGEVIAVAGEACILADSEPGRRVDPTTEALGRDRTKGLFLIADATRWNADGDRFRCDLSISR
jgi:hypothetical protein